MYITMICEFSNYLGILVVSYWQKITVRRSKQAQPPSSNPINRAQWAKAYR